MNTSFRRINFEEINLVHSAYIEVYEWLNAKGIRQWLRPLSKEVFVERQRAGQLFAFYIDDRIVAIVTLAFEASLYWSEAIDAKSFWWIKSLAVVRARRGEGIGKRVMQE